MVVRLTEKQYARLKAGKPVGGAAKYGNTKQTVDGITFDSVREAARFRELKLLAKAGVISDLECHPQYVFIVAGVRVGSYRPDFRYRQRGQVIVEDVKARPTRTTAYLLRLRLLVALYPDIVFKEVY